MGLLGGSQNHRWDGERERRFAEGHLQLVPATANTNYLRPPATPAASPRRPLNPPPPSVASCHPQASFYFRRCRISQPHSSLALAPRTRWMSRGWSSATSSMVPAHVTPNIRDLHYTSVNQTLSSSPLETWLPTKIKQEGMMWFPMHPMPTLAISLHEWPVLVFL